jgi:hypothetical protein
VERPAEFAQQLVSLTTITRPASFSLELQPFELKIAYGSIAYENNVSETVVARGKKRKRQQPERREAELLCHFFEEMTNTCEDIRNGGCTTPEHINSSKVPEASPAASPAATTANHDNLKVFCGKRMQRTALEEISPNKRAYVQRLPQQVQVNVTGVNWDRA